MRATVPATTAGRRCSSSLLQATAMFSTAGRQLICPSCPLAGPLARYEGYDYGRCCDGSNPTTQRAHLCALTHAHTHTSQTASFFHT